MESNNIYTEVIDSIPSAAMKQYLSKYPIQLSILQMATVVSYFSDNARTVCAFKKLSRLTESPNEKEVLLSAISDIENNGSIGNHTQLIYERLFPHDGAPFFPFLERCYFPVLFSVNDKIMYKGESYIIKTIPVINDSCDFSDECYLCYPQNGSGHSHIHVCEAEIFSKNNTVFERVVTGLNEAIDYENGIGTARVDYVNLRQDMNELDELSDKAGGYVIPSGNDEVRYDYRKIIAYCKEQGIEPIDLNIRELGQFVTKKQSDNSKSNIFRRDKALLILKEAYNSCEKMFGQIKDAYLYGSYARGDYRDDSDVNILVTIDLTEEEISDHQWDVAHLSSNLSLKHDITVNINIKSLDQFEKQYSLTPLYQEILKEGIKYEG